MPAGVINIAYIMKFPVFSLVKFLDSFWTLHMQLKLSHIIVKYY